MKSFIINKITNGEMTDATIVYTTEAAEDCVKTSMVDEIAECFSCELERLFGKPIDEIERDIILHWAKEKGFVMLDEMEVPYTNSKYEITQHRNDSIEIEQMITLSTSHITKDTANNFEIASKLRESTKKLYALCRYTKSNKTVRIIAKSIDDVETVVEFYRLQNSIDGKAHTISYPSTSGWEEETCQIIDISGKEVSMPGLSVYDKSGVGFFVYVIDKVDAMLGASKDLVECIEFATRNGCSIICFDRDCVEVDELYTYEW